MVGQGNTDNLRRTGAEARPLDAMDRKILGALARDAGQSFAALGAEVGLSAPAVHERVKRMRAAGVIRGTVALIDGDKAGKPLLAFVHVDTEGWAKTRELLELAELPEIEELHSSTGDTCLILKVRTASAMALEGLLSKIYDLPGVRSTRTYVTLSTHLERPPRAEITDALEEGPHIR